MLNSMVLLSLRSLDLLSAHHCSARSRTTTAARAVHHHCATSAGGTDLYAYVELHGAVELAQFGLVVCAPLQRAQSHHHCSARSAPPLQRAQCTTTAPHQPGALTCMRMLNSMVLLSLRSLDLLSAHHCSARSAPPLQRAQSHHHCSARSRTTTAPHQPGALTCMRMLNSMVLLSLRSLDLLSAHHCSARSRTTTAARAVHHHCATSAGGGTDLYAYVELHGAVELAQFGLVVGALRHNTRGH
ncbi:hypothetical protein O0L34_g6407 [Tuta absoluta]|nr:hypothetical protein O0L34_g6407 [Tuta absoluta]